MCPIVFAPSTTTGSDSGTTSDIEAMILSHNQLVSRQLHEEALLHPDCLLSSSHQIQSDDSIIIEFAAQLTEDCETKSDQIKKIVQFVHRSISYDYIATIQADRGESKQNALAVLESRQGTCLGQVNLAVALLRACGIPALICQGYKLSVGGLHQSDVEQLIAENSAQGSIWDAHAWIEIFDEENDSWLVADFVFKTVSSFKEFSKTTIYGYSSSLKLNFGFPIDSAYTRIAIGSDSFNTSAHLIELDSVFYINLDNLKSSGYKLSFTDVPAPTAHLSRETAEEPITPRFRTSDDLIASVYTLSSTGARIYSYLPLVDGAPPEVDGRSTYGCYAPVDAVAKELDVTISFLFTTPSPDSTADDLVYLNLHKFTP